MFLDAIGGLDTYFFAVSVQSPVSSISSPQSGQSRLVLRKRRFSERDLVTLEKDNEYPLGRHLNMLYSHPPSEFLSFVRSFSPDRSLSQHFIESLISCLVTIMTRCCTKDGDADPRLPASFHMDIGTNFLLCVKTINKDASFFTRKEELLRLQIAPKKEREVKKLPCPSYTTLLITLYTEWCVAATRVCNVKKLVKRDCEELVCATRFMWQALFSVFAGLRAGDGSKIRLEDFSEELTRIHFASKVKASDLKRKGSEAVKKMSTMVDYDFFPLASHHVTKLSDGKEVARVSVDWQRFLIDLLGAFYPGLLGYEGDDNVLGLPPKCFLMFSVREKVDTICPEKLPCGIDSSNLRKAFSAKLSSIISNSQTHCLKRAASIVSSQTGSTLKEMAEKLRHAKTQTTARYLDKATGWSKSEVACLLQCVGQLSPFANGKISHAAIDMDCCSLRMRENILDKITKYRQKQMKK